MGLVGAEITSNALKSNAEWPWYTVPFFAQSAKALMVITSADFVGFSPIVTKETRFAWEQYVNETKPAVSSSLYNHEGPIPPQDPGPFVPCWQLTPEPENVEILNFDLQSVPSFSQGFTALQEGNSILSEPVNSTLLQGLPGVHLDSTDDLDEPRAFLMHPVYSNFSGEAEISGTLAALFRLQYLFRGTQDSRELGMVAVLRDSCGLNHTYNLNGPEVRYAGNTDLHDTTYDHLLVSVPFTDQLYEKNVSFVCSYTLDIYPSKSFESVYITNDPWVYTGVVVGIFFLLSLPLVFYNKMVKRRQDYLVGEAVRTTDILTNLFPSNVHKRLFGRTGEENGRKIADQIKKQQNRDNMASSTQNRITERRPSGDKLGAEVINGMYTTKPIADLFPNTTIMFADMVGFTAWSSEREPAHVFTLLETLFGAFDAIAKRMDVFKVETIGDCYVGELSFSWLKHQFFRYCLLQFFVSFSKF